MIRGKFQVIFSFFYVKYDNKRKTRASITGNMVENFHLFIMIRHKYGYRHT